MPVVATYHSKLQDLDKLIKKFQLFLYSDSEVQRFFSPVPMLSYQSAMKIKDYIVRSKLHPIEGKVGRSTTTNKIYRTTGNF